jgi:hypothetical protein
MSQSRNLVFARTSFFEIEPSDREPSDRTLRIKPANSVFTPSRFLDILTPINPNPPQTAANPESPPKKDQHTQQWTSPTPAQQPETPKKQASGAS